MPLTLTVLRCPPAVTPETRILNGGELSVGRGPGVDWVLADPDQMVSRRHFSAMFRAGGWQITDDSSNGTFVNHDTAPIGKGNKRTLRDRDRLRAGPYEIEVHLHDSDAFRNDPGFAAADPDPYDFVNPAPSGFAASIPDDAFEDPFHESFGSLDAAPPFGTTSFGTSFEQQTQPDHSSVLEDAMRPPAPTGQILPISGGSIPATGLLPDNWEDDLLEGIGGPTAEPPSGPETVSPASVPVQPLAPAALLPDAFGSDPFLEEPPAAVVPPSVPAPVVPNPAIATLPDSPSLDPFVEAAAPAVPPPAPAVAAHSPLVSGQAVADAALLSAFLAGVGLPDAKPADPSATFQRLGEAFRALVAGLRSVLIARAAIKSEFRIEQTMIRARGNNPLKFSADDDDAIAALLGVGRRTDMTAAAAVTDALRDIRLHELASMAAMQSAVRAVMDGLHPDKVRAVADQGGGISVLPGQRKARAWDIYESLHARTVQALSDDFDSVFGKAFARAYEESLDDLSAKERK